MVKLNICGNFLSITLHQEFLAFSLDIEQHAWEFKKLVRCYENIKKSNDASFECCAFSPCGKYFGVCFDRNIIIYETTEWCALFSALAERKTCSLRFFPKSRTVLLADKSGSASFYSFQENKLQKNDLILGHNSMLTSALISENEKFILTCDRDEKIRVSNYPNVYNIEEYCLGHKMFVSCIDFLPTDSRILISSSGDGTIRLWNFLTGKQLAMFDFNKIGECNSKTTIIKFVTCLQSYKTVIAVAMYQSNQIYILNVLGTFNEGFKIDLSKTLKLDSLPFDITFQSETLVCLLPNKDNPLIFWSSNENDLNKTTKSFKKVKQYLFENWDSFLEMSSKISDDVPVLFKRETDNLQEYEQRKKARLLKTGKTS